jgi:hypothetical protein
MRAELSNFAGCFFADVNGDTDHSRECSDKDEGDQPGGNMTHAQRPVK